MGILLVYDVTDERSFNSASLSSLSFLILLPLTLPHRLPLTQPLCRLSALSSLTAHRPAHADIRTWHANIEQHASEGVNKILIGNKSDWTEKRAVTEEQGRELANELGIKFMETSAKINEGVEEAFFTLARYVIPLCHNATRNGAPNSADPPAQWSLSRWALWHPRSFVYELL